MKRKTPAMNSAEAEGNISTKKPSSTEVEGNISTKKPAMMSGEAEDGMQSEWNLAG